MGQVKNYFNNLLCRCAPDDGFGQDAIVGAVLTGKIVLVGDTATDQDAIMAQYDVIVRDHQQALQSTGREP